MGSESGDVVLFDLNAFAKRYAAEEKSAKGASLPPAMKGSCKSCPFATTGRNIKNFSAPSLTRIEYLMVMFDSIIYQ